MNNGGMMMSHQGLSWILMKAVGFSTDQWDRVLDPLNGHGPINEEQFRRIRERIRRKSHMHEPGSFHKTGAVDDFMTNTAPE